MSLRDTLIPGELEKQLAGLTFQLTGSVRSRVLGQHQGSSAGSSLEFAKHKEYVPGDDLRTVNWKVSARLNRMLVKQFVQEASSTAMILLDASPSMQFGEESDRKFFKACQLVATLSWILLRQGDRVGLVVFSGNKVVDRVPAQQIASHHLVIMECLERNLLTRVQRDNSSSKPPEAIMQIAQIERWADSSIMLISDFLFDFERSFKMLSELRKLNTTSFLFHMIHPTEYYPSIRGERVDWTRNTEAAFNFSRAGRFRSPETGQAVLADPGAVRREYLERYRQYLAELKQAASESMIRYDHMITNDPIESLLFRFSGQV